MAVNHRTLGMTTKARARFDGFGMSSLIALATFIVLYFFNRSSPVATKALMMVAMLSAITFIIQLIRLIRLNERDP